MGNSLGEVADSLGATETFGFRNTSRAIINAHGIEPWHARDLVRRRLQRQSDLAKNHPFKEIPVRTGVNWFKDRLGSDYTHLSRHMFMEQGRALLRHSKVRHSQQDINTLYDIFDAMDFDGNGELSIGEWAGGVTVFFQGDMRDKVCAAFSALDTNGDETLDWFELKEYLKPFIGAMTPPQAHALRPLLLKRITNDIFEEMDFDHNTMISYQEMMDWSAIPGNNIINRVAELIENEVYAIWAHHHRGGHGHGRSPYNGKGGYGDSRSGYDFNSHSQHGHRRHGTTWDDVVPGLSVVMPTIGVETYDRRRRRGPPRAQFVGSSDPSYGGYHRQDGQWNGSVNSYMTPYHRNSVYGGGF